MSTPRLSALIEDALAQAAGPADKAFPVSLALDYGVDGEGEIRVETTIDRATRSLKFISARALWPDGRVAAGAQAVFRLKA
ncbi:MAG: hypothetical protein ACK4RV_18525 [Caulobacter sp.]|jgi:hypothetical protein